MNSILFAILLSLPSLLHHIIKTISMDVQEYAKEKGIPVGSIPVNAFRKAQQAPITIRQAENSKAEAFKKLCKDTKELVDKCTASKSVSGN